LQAQKAIFGEAFAPLADGVAITTEFESDLLVGGVVVLSSTQDDVAAKNQGLGSRAGADKGLQLVAKFW